MEIRRVSIRGFMALEQVDIELGRVNVFVGPNGAGKSSLLEAIMIPIFGMARAEKKKDWGYMIRAQHRSAEIMLTVHENNGTDVLVHEPAYRINQKSVSGSPLRSPDLFDRILLDPLEFFSLPSKTKADLAGDVYMDPEILKNELGKRGVSSRAILDEASQIIERYRLASAEKILEEKRLQATRAVVDPGPAPVYMIGGEPADIPTEEVLTSYSVGFKGWKEEMEAAHHEKNRLDRVRMETRARATRVAEARRIVDDVNVPDAFPRQAEMDSSQERLEGAQAQYHALYRDLQGLGQEVCPTCNQTWVPGHAKINKQLSAVSDTIRSEEASLFQLRDEHSKWRARVISQESAQKIIDEAGTLPLEEPSDTAVQAIVDRIKRAEEAMLQFRNLIDGYHHYKTRYDTWYNMSTRAALAKADREDWDRAVKAIRDPSFKIVFVADPIQKARERLQKTTKVFDLKVEITDDFDVLVWNRPWWLLSNAYKMAASILLADAFGHSRGHRILKVDGADTLVGSMQHCLVDFISFVKNDYDTILLALASEDKPSAFSRLEEILDKQQRQYLSANWYWVANGRAVFRKVL